MLPQSLIVHPPWNCIIRPMNPRLAGILAGITAAAIWGGMYVVSKVVLAVIPPFSLLVLRLILGVAGLAAILAIRRSPAPPHRRVLPALAVGALGFGLSLGLQFIGTRLSTASNAALVTSASPAFMVVFAIVILGEQATVRRVAALILASLGVTAVIDPRSVQFGSELLWGNLALLGAALTWGLYSVLVRWLSFSLPVLTVSLWSFVGGLVLAVPAAAVELQVIPVGPLTPLHWLGVFYLGLISTALAMYLWNKSLALLEAGVVSLLFFAQPLVGVSLGALLLGEQLGPAFWIGAALISSGLVLVGREREPAVPVDPALEGKMGGPA